MNPSDSHMLHDFLGQLVQARGIQKDPEADALIQRAVAQQPDAAYLLVQRVLLMEQALSSAKSRIAALESQLQNQGRESGGFLDPHSWGSRGQASHPQPHHMSYQHAIPGSMSRGLPGFLRGGGGGSGGMLGSIAATAAGVAAGSFLFHGLDNLFHDHDGGASHLLGGGSEFAGGDLSGSSLAEQAGLGDIGTGNSMLADESGLDGNGGFFDGDGSDDGLFG
ncbi:DUF2076 family protein [Massilia yuzhufengensis]|uniref:DUF2076 domain-containing protein n=1 Tax=Massilia yuzhufengensis TaxID=1164594 RepID=A0A1I1FLW8_9BURK|nr:DUF2076 family protein [Massilia yuzhufengensis]SFC00519.1 hypothetical protein SAMN05216204_10350 [Massilia yuzhufengensis]